MDWDELRKELSAIPGEVKVIHDRMALAVHRGWLTNEQAEWILFGEEDENRRRLSSLVGILPRPNKEPNIEAAREAWAEHVVTEYKTQISRND